MSDQDVFPQTWITTETPPRRLTAVGVSLVDQDVLVAYLDNDTSPRWIVKSSGAVCGLFNVRAALKTGGPGNE
jgi:hypothetical protein